MHIQNIKLLISFIYKNSTIYTVCYVDSKYFIHSDWNGYFSGNQKRRQVFDRYKMAVY